MEGNRLDQLRVRYTRRKPLGDIPTGIILPEDFRHERADFAIEAALYGLELIYQEQWTEARRVLTTGWHDAENAGPDGILERALLRLEWGYWTCLNTGSYHAARQMVEAVLEARIESREACKHWIFTGICPGGELTRNREQALALAHYFALFATVLAGYPALALKRVRTLLDHALSDDDKALLYVALSDAYRKTGEFDRAWSASALASAYSCDKVGIPAELLSTLRQAHVAARDEQPDLALEQTLELETESRRAGTSLIAAMAMPINIAAWRRKSSGRPYQRLQIDRAIERMTLRSQRSRFRYLVEVARNLGIPLKGKDGS